MTTTVLRTFEIYQKSRVQFVQTVAELAKRKENFEALQSAGALLLLRPLLLDVVPSVAQTACIAIGRMAALSHEIAEEIILLDILPDIIDSIDHQSRFYKKCAAFVLRSVAKHSADLANKICEAKGLEALGKILTEFDPSVKEAGCWALSYIAKHNSELAEKVANGISLKALVLCIQEPEIGLRRIAANALMQIARHKPELARAVAKDELALLPFLAPLISHGDTLLKRQVIACFSHIASHNQSLSKQIIQYVDATNLIARLKDEDSIVRINTAECIKNIVRHKAESAKLICTKDGHRALVEYIQENHSDAREPALWALSYIASFDETMAMSIIDCSGIPIIRDALIRETDPNIQMRAAHTLGCLGQHSEAHAKNLADNDILSHLMHSLIEESHKTDNKNKDLEDQCKSALKKIIQNCKSVQALDSLITDITPTEVLIQVFKQLAKTLPAQPMAKKQFAESRGLQKILIKKDTLKKSGGDNKTLTALIDDICRVYPPEMVSFFSPEYENNLIARIDDYNKSIKD